MKKDAKIPAWLKGGKEMEEQDTIRIRELTSILKKGEYREPGFMLSDYGGYEFTFPIKKRRKAMRELKKIAKNSSSEVRKFITKETGLELNLSSRILKYLGIGLFGLVIGVGAGKGCERYVYHQKIKEVQRKVGSVISEEYNIRYPHYMVEWFKKEYQEKQFEKNVYYMGIGGLVGLVVSCIGTSIIKSEIELENAHDF